MLNATLTQLNTSACCRLAHKRNETHSIGAGTDAHFLTPVCGPRSRLSITPIKSPTGPRFFLTRLHALVDASHSTYAYALCMLMPKHSGLVSPMQAQLPLLPLAKSRPTSPLRGHQKGERVGTPQTPHHGWAQCGPSTPPVPPILPPTTPPRLLLSPHSLPHTPVTFLPSVAWVFCRPLPCMI